MALIKCPECGREVSSLAGYCVNCGCPLTDDVISNQLPEAGNDSYKINHTLGSTRQPGKIDLKSILGKAGEKLKAISKRATETKAYTTITSCISKLWTSLRSRISNTIASFRSLPAEKKSTIKKAVLSCVLAVLLLTTFLIILFSTCVIMHHYEDANCTEPKICRYCEKTTGAPLGHKYKAHAKIPETCTDYGFMEYICDRCDKKKTDLIEPHPHTASAATCMEPSICQECNTQLEPALGHELVDVAVEVAATCTSEGLQKGVCSVCGEDITDTIPFSDHKPGEWKTEISATVFDLSAERKRYCTSCNLELESEEYDLSREEKGKYLKSNCKTYSYDDLMRYPDKHTGKLAKFKGEVVQVMSSGFNTVLRVNVTKDRYYWDDTIYVLYEGKTVDGANICEDDIIWLYGVMNGTKTYETILGSEVTIPYLSCYYIEFA